MAGIFEDLILSPPIRMRVVLMLMMLLREGSGVLALAIRWVLRWSLVLMCAVVLRELLWSRLVHLRRPVVGVELVIGRVWVVGFMGITRRRQGPVVGLVAVHARVHHFALVTAVRQSCMYLYTSNIGI